MCRPTALPRSHSAGKENSNCSPLIANNSKRRRTGDEPHPRRVRFAPEATLHEVAPLCNSYNHRFFFYNKNELDRLYQMEIRRNQGWRKHVDQPDSDMTWRGLEQFQTNEGPSAKHANIQSHVQLILKEASAGKDGDQLRFLSETLSQEQVQEAQRRGSEDEAVALGKPFTAVTDTASNTAHQRLLSYWMVHPTGASLQDQLLWMVRTIAFFAVFGFFHSTH